MSEIRASGVGGWGEASNGSNPTGSFLQWQMLRHTEWVLKHKLQFQLGLINPSSGNNKIRGFVWLLGHARLVTKVHGYFKRQWRNRMAEPTPGGRALILEEHVTLEVSKRKQHSLCKGVLVAREVRWLPPCTQEPRRAIPWPTFVSSDSKTGVHRCAHRLLYKCF